MYKDYKMSAESSKVSAKEENLQTALQRKKLTFVRLLFPDIHGILRGKVYNCTSLKHTAETIPAYAPWTLQWGEIPRSSIDNVGSDDILMRPVLSTLFERSWSKNNQKTKIGQVLCDLVNFDGSPVETDVRHIANLQVERLKDRGLFLYSATEFEFRLYKPGKEGTDFVPVVSDINMTTEFHMQTFEGFFIDMQRRLKAMNIATHHMHDEMGCGQVEIVPHPVWGIKYADDSTLLRTLIKETAIHNGMQACFMPKDIIADAGNGFHFNHSLWTKNVNGELSNVMHDPSKDDGIGELGRHWLAGLIHHSPAITALSNPTVNCYRRIFSGLIGPLVADWGIDDRLASYRMKVGKREKDTYLENRLPSSVANPYLVMAASIAAGLNGIDNKMELPGIRDENATKLPYTPSDALDMLQKDEVICEALGRKVITTYVALKKEEIKHFKDVETTKSAEEVDLTEELSAYQFFA